MADVTLRFRFNPRTGRRELVISYESDADALAHEHERDHRALVESILGVPLGADTDLAVERVSPGEAAAEAAGDTDAAPVRQAERNRQG